MNSEINVNINSHSNNFNNRNKKESIGFAAFFDQRDSNIMNLFEDYITDYNAFRKYPAEIKDKRK